jgi:polar amino acid transport system substrate-binding protein
VILFCVALNDYNNNFMILRRIIMKKKTISMVLASLMLFGLTACGSSDTTQTTTTTDNSADVTASADQTSDSTDSGEKVWKIATDTVFKPFEYTDDNGDFVGIDMDILAAVADDQGFKYEVNVLGWDASIAACQAGQADGMIAGASITDERKESGWIFSDGYYDANQCLAVKDDSDITGFEDLSGQSVAVKTGTMSASYAESISGDYGFTVTYFEDSPTMYQAVIGGQVAGCFDDTPIMSCTIKESGLAMKLVDGTGNDPAAYGFAIFNSDNQELVDMFNEGLANIRANGTYDEIIAKYLGE